MIWFCQSLSDKQPLFFRILLIVNLCFTFYFKSDSTPKQINRSDEKRKDKHFNVIECEDHMQKIKAIRSPSLYTWKNEGK